MVKCIVVCRNGAKIQKGKTIHVEVHVEVSRERWPGSSALLPLQLKSAILDTTSLLTLGLRCTELKGFQSGSEVAFPWVCGLVRSCSIPHVSRECFGDVEAELLNSE